MWAQLLGAAVSVQHWAKLKPFEGRQQLCHDRSSWLMLEISRHDGLQLPGLRVKHSYSPPGILTLSNLFQPLQCIRRLLDNCGLTISATNITLMQLWKCWSLSIKKSNTKHYFILNQKSEFHIHFPHSYLEVTVIQVLKSATVEWLVCLCLVDIEYLHDNHCIMVKWYWKPIVPIFSWNWEVRVRSIFFLSWS